MIENFEQLSDAVVGGQTEFRDHGEVYTRISEDERLILFKYLPTCVFREENEWTWLEKVSRGLILDRKTGEIVARPFDKFFGAKPGDIKNIDAVYEKVDGSLLIGFYHPDTDQFRFATNGSFYSEQANAANEWWRENKLDEMVNVGDNVTLLCEYVAKDNRIVVDYGSWEGFVVLAIRFNSTGEYATRNYVKAWYEREFAYKNPQVDFVRLAKQYDISDPAKLFDWAQNAESIDEGEGYVVYDHDGKMFKVKSAVYLQVHKLVSMITEKNIWQAMVDGKADKFREAIPDEFINEYDQIRDIIGHRIDKVVSWVTLDMNDIAETMGAFDIYLANWQIGEMQNRRKEFAFLAKEKEFPQYLFFMLGDSKINLNDKILADYMKLVKRGVFPEIQIERKSGMYD